MARTPLLPLLALSLGASPSLIGIIVSTSTVTGIFLKAPFGALSDYIGRKRMLIVGALIFALMPFTYIIVTVAWLLIVIRMIHGMATSIYGPVANAVVADIAGKEKGKYLSLFSLIKIGTNSLGGLVGGWFLYMISRGGNYTLKDLHYAYLFCGILGLIALVIAFSILPNIESSKEFRSIKDSLIKMVKGLKETTHDIKILMTSSMESFQNMTMGAGMAFLPILVVKEYHFSTLQAGLLWSIITGTSVMLKPVMGIISDRMTRWKLIVLGMILCAISFVGFTLTSNFFMLIGVSILFGISEAIVTTSTISYVAERAKETNLGASLGIFGTIADIGQAIGPILIGFFLTYLSYFKSFIIISSIIVIWTGMYVFILLNKGHFG